MAKTKGTNAKIKELKGIKPVKIDEKELSSLQSTIRTMDKLTDDVGRMEIQKYSLMKAMENVQNNIETIRQGFNSKYGTDNINIQDGTISYLEDTNQPDNGEINKKD